MMQEIRMFLTHLTDTKPLAPNSLDSYRRDLEDMARQLEAQHQIVKIGEVRPYHLTAYMQGLRGRGRSNATLTRRLVSMRAFYEFVTAKRLITENPVLQLEPPRAERKPPKALSVSDVERLLEAPDTDSPAGVRDRTMLETLYATGMRVTELATLDERDVRTELNLLSCRGSRGKERMIPIGSLCRLWMVKYMQEARPLLLREGQPESALFINHLGSRMSRQGLWKLIKKYASAAGVSTEVTPHTLRHSFAYHLLDNGADLRSVQEMMGHADLTATQIYQPSGKPKLKDVYDSYHPRSRPAKEAVPHED